MSQISRQKRAVIAHVNVHFAVFDLLEGKAPANEKEIMKVYGALEKYFPTWVGYNMAKCGGCIRACVSLLEKKGGCMEHRFKEPLRTGKAWVMDR